MITLRRIQDGQRLDDINIPELKEVGLKAYVQTLKALEPTLDQEQNADIVRAYCKALSCWTGQDYDLITSFPFDVVTRAIEIIVTTITHRDSDFYSDFKIFEHEGQRFEVSGIGMIASQYTIEALSAGQAIEALEVMRAVSELVEKEGDEDGSYMYTQYLKLLAILTAEPNSEFFAGQAHKRERFIEERVAFFEDIAAAPALSADFFLTALMTESERKGLCIGFLTGWNLLLSLELLPTRQRIEHLKSAQQTQHSNDPGTGA
jgi:hypothetical protein